MARFFIDISYKGTGYAGFQVQQNANTIQAEMEKAMAIYLRQRVDLTGSSRTDTGVHALQNFFHFDFADNAAIDWKKVAYRLNAILPPDIVVKDIKQMPQHAHCRFDAKYRLYEYSVYWFKNPFLADRSFYYPYRLDMDLLNEAAAVLMTYRNFKTFSKKNTQVKNFACELFESKWILGSATLTYRVSGSRFLRGMVRGLTGTMLRVGAGKCSLAEFRRIIESEDAAGADFSVPPQGLTLVEVGY